MKSFALATVTGMAWMLLSCGRSSPNAGATTETTNGIVVLVRDSVHQPLPGARVVLYRSQDISVVETATANSNGEVLMRNAHADSGQWLEVLQTDSSAMAWQSLPPQDTLQVQLPAAASLRIRTGVPASAAATLPGQLQIQGTPYVAQREGTEYHFRHLPPGSYANPWAQVNLDAGARLDTLVSLSPAAQFLEFDNFDDGDGISLPGAFNASQGWYLNQELGATWLQPTQTSDLPTAIHEDSAYSGRSLDLRFALGDSGTVVLGTHLGPDSVTYDLSNLGSVRLRVRGNATFDFALESDVSPDSGEYRKAVWPLQASTEWQEIVVRPSEVELDAVHYQAPWEEVSSQVALLSFFIREGSWLQIDAIVLEGVHPQTLAP